DRSPGRAELWRTLRRLAGIGCAQRWAQLQRRGTHALAGHGQRWRASACTAASGGRGWRKRHLSGANAGSSTILANTARLLIEHRRQRQIDSERADRFDDGWNRLREEEPDGRAVQPNRGGSGIVAMREMSCLVGQRRG